MIRFEQVGQARIRCGLPKGRRARVDFAFPIGWVPYVCCDETVIQTTAFDDLRAHVELLSLERSAKEKFCRFFDREGLVCTHKHTVVVEALPSDGNTPP
ncbi:MAG: hypothetical protein GXP25_09220 [Planctomycetes bacterium]|nr:hypothetical protein [Planctomycetota bacterium]